MHDRPAIGLLVDLGALKETKTLVLWGRTIRPNKTLSPHMKLLEVPIDWKLIRDKTKSTVLDTYIAFE